MKVHTECVYSIVKEYMERKELDVIDEDSVVKIVSVHGLNALIEEKLAESVGVIDGRPVYILHEMK